MADYIDQGLERMGINISKPILAMTCIIFGVLVILFPNLLVWIIGLFLVIQGALLLTDYFVQEKPRTIMTTTKGVFCHSCGASNGKEAAYCKRCGKKLVRSEQITTAEPPEQIVTAEPQEVIQ